MSLDPDAQLVIDLIKAAGRPPMQTLSPPEAREAYRNSRGVLTPPLPEVAQIRELAAPGPAGDIPLRYYRGLGTSSESPLPCLVYLHGGGWVIGDLDTHDYVCRKLANGAGCVVIAADYRLAPEHKFPAAVEDSVAAFGWIAAHAAELGIDPAKIAVGGDSAGGNLSAVIAHKARDGDLPGLAFQLLLYPSTDMRMVSPAFDREDLAATPLSGAVARWFRDHYLTAESDSEHWWASPLAAPRFDGLAPAFVLTVGYDPLAGEGQDYARKLEESGVRVGRLHLSDQMHGFLTMSKIVRSAETTLDILGAALRRGLDQP